MNVEYNFQPNSPDWNCRNTANWHVVKYLTEHCGLNVMPLRCDGTKAPKIKWAAYQLEKIPPEVTKEHFCVLRNHSGIGVICGKTSGNLEILDFDQIEFVVPFYEEIKRNLDPSVWSKLVVVVTPKNGRHLYYRCDEIEGNQKLAYSADGKIAIETRGQGGQAVMPGSPWKTHKKNQPYVLRRNVFHEIPTITPADRKTLHDIARSFCRKPATLATPPETETFQEFYGIASAKGDRPGDEFNALVEWAEILEPKGWSLLTVSGGVSYWQRPEKLEPGPSATTGYCRNEDGQELLYVFSSNATPFDAGCTYNKFSAYSRLYHEGSYRKAAEALAAQGFGRKSLTRAEAEVHEFYKEFYS